MADTQTTIHDYMTAYHEKVIGYAKHCEQKIQKAKQDNIDKGIFLPLHEIVSKCLAQHERIFICIYYGGSVPVYQFANMKIMQYGARIKTLRDDFDIPIRCTTEEVNGETHSRFEIMRGVVFSDVKDYILKGKN